MRLLELERAIDRVALATCQYRDEELVRDWPNPPATGERWDGYGDNLREVLFQAYQELRELATDIAASRPAPTTAQLALAHHQRAYRDLTGALAAAREDEYDLAPAEGEWPLRMVLFHMVQAELGFSIQIDWAREQRRDGQAPPLRGPEDAEARYAETSDAGTLAEALGRFAATHERIVSAYSRLADDELSTPSLWWEGYQIPILFRLHRFDAHLREHTIQVDKTLAGIGHPPSEAERLIRLLHQALGECEAAAIGSESLPHDRVSEVTAALDRIATTFEELNRAS